jgi:hypothetical protein
MSPPFSLFSNWWLLSYLPPPSHKKFFEFPLRTLEETLELHPSDSSGHQSQKREERREMRASRREAETEKKMKKKN